MVMYKDPKSGTGVHTARKRWKTPPEHPTNIKTSEWRIPAMALDTTMISDILQGFMTLIVIMDPFVSLPVLLSMTKGVSNATRKAITNKAVLIAGTIMLVFYVASTKIFDIIGIGLPSFMVAGGIVLLILGLE